MPFLFHFPCTILMRRFNQATEISANMLDLILQISILQSL